MKINWLGAFDFGSILENQDIVLRELDFPRRKLAELLNKT